MLPVAIPLPRDSVAWFAGEMERLLRANDHRPGWQNDYLLDLLDRLREETFELNEVIVSPALYAGSKPDNYSPEQLRQIIAEAGDVANFAMMIADNARRALEDRGDAAVG